MTSAELASALGSPVERRDGWYCLCPAHADTEPSLCVTEKDGKLLWVCRAGCDQKIVTAAIKARVPALFATVKSTVKPRSRIVCAYDYLDAAGKLVGQVVRFDPKGFRQRRPDPDKPGAWLWNMKGVDLPLYNLPALLTADPKRTVVIVEGEKDVESLRKLGILGTTNAGGAGKWRGTHSENLRGRTVVVVPDADVPGAKHADDILAGLRGVAEYVRRAPCPAPHKDVSEYIESGASQQAIRALIRTDLPVASVATERKNEPPKGAATPIELYEDDSSGEAKDNVITVDFAPDWRQSILRTDKFQPRPLLANVMIALRKCPIFKGALSFDTFVMKTTVGRDLPWRKADGVEWQDFDASELANWCQHMDIRVGSLVCHEAAVTVSKENARDSLQEYLRGLVWDGESRLNRVGSVYFGAAAESIANTYWRWALIGAVARAFQPGAKVDSTIVLEGLQGITKSKALSVLFDPLGARWFRDHLPELDSKDSAIQLIGAWCIEIAELATVASRRSELERVKAFMTRQVDSYRPPYGRTVVDFARRTVFVGTTNKFQYLHDPTGNRRWWPVKCGAMNVEALAADANQIWAEAVLAHDDGAMWWPDAKNLPRETLEQIEGEQEDRVVADSWQSAVADFLVGKQFVTGVEVLTFLKFTLAQITRREEMKVAELLQKLGWVNSRPTLAGGRTRGYAKSTELKYKEKEGEESEF